MDVRLSDSTVVWSVPADRKGSFEILWKNGARTKPVPEDLNKDVQKIFLGVRRAFTNWGRSPSGSGWTPTDRHGGAPRDYWFNSQGARTIQEASAWVRDYTRAYMEAWQEQGEQDAAAVDSDPKAPARDLARSEADNARQRAAALPSAPSAGVVGAVQEAGAGAVEWVKKNPGKSSLVAILLGFGAYKVRR